MSGSNFIGSAGGTGGALTHSPCIILCSAPLLYVCSTARLDWGFSIACLQVRLCSALQAIQLRRKRVKWINDNHNSIFSFNIFRMMFNVTFSNSSLQNIPFSISHFTYARVCRQWKSMV